jgi:hypothetical protein
LTTRAEVPAHAAIAGGTLRTSSRRKGMQMNGAVSLRPVGATATVLVFPGDNPQADGSIAISDEELTALALSADPNAPLDEDAIPMAVYLAARPGPLPNWYMPEATARARRWRWPVVGVLMFAFLLTAGLGLCATYGALGFA